MALSVGVANNTGTIGQPVKSSGPAPSISVGNASPGILGMVGNNYGLQGYGPAGYSSTPLTINGGSSAAPATPTAPASTPNTAATAAATAAAAATARAETDFGNLKNSTFSSINDAVGSGARGYTSSIQDYLDSRKQQQNTVNNDAVQNELSREQGMQGITDMVGNGIKSGGVILANDNAGSSSAGEALARAYGIQGRQQASSVGNQFAQGQNKVNTEENNITAADTTEQRHVGEDKTNTINSIVNSTRSQLASLNQSAAYASIPDRVDIEAKIAEVKQQALDALSAYDGQLSSGVTANAPQDAGSVRASATNLLTAGTAPENSFDYTTDVPAQLQGSGQFASSLPIFISPNARKTATA
jgi:hypothetical protein